MIVWGLLTVQVSGVMRIIMKPILDDVPVVAAMVVSLRAPPQVWAPDITCPHHSFITIHSKLCRFLAC